VRARGDTATVEAASDGSQRIITGRQPCLEANCFASFDAGFAQSDEIRHCNRSGPDGGHSHRWDATSWHLVGAMEHDRS
jgi:hypothetical protein